MSEPWFSEQTAGLVGGMLGTACGVVGGVYGSVVGVLAGRGRAKPVVLGMHWLVVFGGAVLAATGVAALFAAQPWYVWFVFLLPGTIQVVVPGLLTPVLHARYRQAEELRMARQNAV